MALDLQLAETKLLSQVVHKPEKAIQVAVFLGACLDYCPDSHVQSQ